MFQMKVCHFTASQPSSNVGIHSLTEYADAFLTLRVKFFVVSQCF